MRTIIFFLCSWCFISVVSANLGDVESSEAALLFRDGKFQDAALLYQRAIDRGDERSSTRYNLAVSQFKSGQYDQSLVSFEKLVDDEIFGGLARLNLGMIFIKKDKIETAVIWLDQCLEFGASDGSVDLAKKLLDRIDKEQSGGVAVSKFGLVSVGGSATDRNLRLDGLASDSNKYSLSSDLNFLYGRDLNDIHLGRSTGILNILGSKSFDSSDYDFAYGSLGVDYIWIDAPIKLGMVGNVSGFSLGRSPYQIEPSLAVNSSYRFLDNTYAIKSRMAGGWIRGLKAEYQYENGSRLQFRVELFRYFSQNYISASYDFEQNDRADDVNGSLFSSYSPRRNAIKAIVSLKPVSNLSGKLTGEFRNSDYRRENRMYTGDSIRRVERRYRLVSEMSYAFLKNWNLNLSYAFEINRSTIASYAYKRNKFAGEVAWSF